MSKATWSLILFLCCLPGITLANSEFSQIQDKLLLHGGTKEYRLRASGKPWQLLNIQDQIEGHLVFDDQLFLVAAVNSHKSLYLSKNGIGLSVVPEIQDLDSIVTQVISDSLFILGDTGQGLKLWQYAQGNFVQLSSALALPSDALARLIVIDEKVYLLSQQGGSLTVYLWQNSWIAVTGLPCNETTVVNAPIPLFTCDGIAYMLDSSGTPQQLIAETSQIVGSSDSLIFSKSTQTSGRYYILRQLGVTQIDLSGDPSLSNTQVLGNRIFFGINSVLSELDWNVSSPNIIALPASQGTLVAEDTQPSVFFFSQSGSWDSTITGRWRTITVASNFSRVKKITAGYLAYEEDGANIQYSADGTLFSLRNGSWSVNSKIKDVVEYGNDVYVYLLNASQNPNLYRTTNLVNWSRLTLPTKPTLQLPIIQARGLAAGTLVELEGVVTVLKDEVGSEIVYLSDQTGGIQLFLSSEKGNIEASRFDNAGVTGEISTSQTKRVTLSEPTDYYALGGKTTIKPIESPTISTAQEQANRYQLRGLVGSINSDDFLLSDATASLKIHLKSAKSLLTSGANISLVALLDWNASTSKNEGWYTNEELTIIQEPVAALNATPTKQPISSSSHASSPAQARVARAEIPFTKPTQPTTLVSASTEKPSPAKEVPLPALIALISTTLLLAVRGKRLRKFFSSL